MAAERFVAIRRPSARKRSRGRGAASASTELGAALGRSATKLADVGFSYVTSPAEFSNAPAAGEFTDVSGSDMFVLNKEKGTSAQEVAESLEGDYIVMPDVALNVPRPELEDEEVEEAQSVDEVLPPETGVAKAHAEGVKGKGAVIAVLDSGCAGPHREFSGRTIDFAVSPPGEDASVMSGMLAYEGAPKEGHGTHVSGIAGGSTVGVAPEADLVVMAVMEREPYETTALRVWRAMDWLIRRRDEPDYRDRPVILNLSVGFPPSAIKDRVKLAEAVDGLQQLLAVCLEVEILPVVAIGNDGPNTVCAPGYLPESLSVGAVDYDLRPWESTGGGPGPPPFNARQNPDLAGFGCKVLSSMRWEPAGPHSIYGRMSGTSMAAPYVVGVAALVASTTGKSGEALRNHMISTALPLHYPKDRVGSGLARYAP